MDSRGSGVMVQLTVKGTQHSDEFVFVCRCEEQCGPLAMTLATVQNMRHRVRLQLYSVADLLDAADRASPELAPLYRERYAFINQSIRDPKQQVLETTYDQHWRELRDLTRRIFPKECEHPDGDAAAVDKLYELHENPDLDEDYRLHIYHCRAILDPDYHKHEMIDVKRALMWFCGKTMPADETVGKYCSNNEKSRIVVKLAPFDGAAPSKEPRIDYSQQRQLKEYYDARRAEFASLEESELRDRALQKDRSERKLEALSTLAPPTSGDPKLHLDAVRSIHRNAQVTVTDAE